MHDLQLEQQRRDGTVALGGQVGQDEAEQALVGPGGKVGRDEPAAQGGLGFHRGAWEPVRVVPAFVPDAEPVPEQDAAFVLGPGGLGLVRGAWEPARVVPELDPDGEPVPEQDVALVLGPDGPVLEVVAHDTALALQRSPVEDRSPGILHRAFPSRFSSPFPLDISCTLLVSRQLSLQQYPTPRLSYNHQSGYLAEIHPRKSSYLCFYPSVPSHVLSSAPFLRS